MYIILQSPEFTLQNFKYFFLNLKCTSGNNAHCFKNKPAFIHINFIYRFHNAIFPSKWVIYLVGNEILKSLQC